MFSIIIRWWLGGTTSVYGINNENEIVNTVHEVPYGHAKRFDVFKGEELIASFDEFENIM